MDDLRPMRAFLDTNVLVDVVAQREPFFHDSQSVLALCALREIEGVVSDLTFCNLAYILRKQLGNDQVRASLRILKSILVIVPTGEAAIGTALLSDAGDFEDDVQLAAAMNCGADVIVTRNVRHFNASTIRVCTPTDILIGK